MEEAMNLLVTFTLVSTLAVIHVSISYASATPAKACVIANFKNAANACPAGIRFRPNEVRTSKADMFSLFQQPIVRPRSAAETPAAETETVEAGTPETGCVKTNVKNFRDRCAT
jgi:hypothetical protein